MKVLRSSSRFSGLALSAALLSLAVKTAPAHAQGVTNDAARQANQIERQQAEQDRLRQEEMLRKTTRAPQGRPTTAPDTASSAPGETCLPVSRISVSGTTLVPAATVTHTIRRWEGRCLGLAELNSVLEALTYLYVERGYIASRAYLPEQDLSDGSLDISVIEGSLEDITLNGKAPSDNRIATAFPGIRGEPANLRDIEQGLDQINRLRSSKGKIALQSGKGQGGSVLDVAVEQARPWHVSLSADNLGGNATGIYQSRADFGLDNIFGVNDEWLFGYQRSMDHHPLFLSSDRPNSNTLTAAVSVPYGYWTFGINGSWSNYHSTLQGPLSAIETSGGSHSVAPYVSRVLHRDQTSKTWMTGRLTWKETENFLLGSRIDVSSRVLSVATVELGHSRQLLGGQASVSFGYNRGLDILGAFDDSTAPAGSPKGQFETLSASLGYFRTQELGAATMIFNTSVTGQWTDDLLFGSEQMSLGGYSTVRGAREAILYSGKAILMRNELSVLLPELNDAEATRIIGRLEPYVALDLGHSAADPSGTALGGNIIGGAIGLRNRGGRINFDVSYADILSMPDLPSSLRPSSGLVQARLSVSF
ncbi:MULTISPECIES: ShlB/FhaC/HecB family hemolysin secretion/activation protein [Agrobacterium tumefaciens complex]|uniref:ShlB/FhaC/HecB family hemolysin secretion/activation protein n=1 Tax=Agrobacterium burrii TaxID=2815339 RepID=A0ABS3EI05_9HYPH|nr:MULTISPECIES: ShlB/FhaC/HecB family hemolysin secretion/activation protein [Agrobacterium tumefaciens complex]MBO0131600.1 ShlB/FhaC/HecB family hemolysin secretion/activation protein [Agrobacterium burrii]NTZ91996.1 ShlB/FhaC/HecB family hemolysin secretion/activation protein [Agrobacterium tumefaciens]